MRYTNLNHVQLFVLALLVGLISGGIVVAVKKYEELKLLPIVTVSPTGECIKVTNFENGHAFTCQDRDILLRKYRKDTASAS